MKSLKKLPLTLFAVLAAALVFGACKSPPTDEINRAIEIVTRAENDPDAQTYASNMLGRAREALAQMQTEVDSKRYDSARRFGEEAVAAAERALSDGKAGAERAKNEASSLLNAIGFEIAETEGDLDAAKKVPNIRLDFVPLDQDLSSVKGTYSDAERSLIEANYRDAVAKAQPIRSALADIRAQIREATAALSRKN